MASILDRIETEVRTEITYMDLHNLGFRDSGTIVPYFDYRIAEWNNDLQLNTYTPYITVYFTHNGDYKNYAYRMAYWTGVGDYLNKAHVDNPSLEDVEMALQILKNAKLI